MQLSCAVTAVPRDYVQAYFCLSLRGEDAADVRERLAPALIRGVERLIGEWNNTGQALRSKPRYTS